MSCSPRASRGLAPISATRPAPRSLLARERAARAAKLGLWADPYYVIVGAGERGGASGRTGSIHGRRGQGIVGPRERRHYLYEFRPPLVGGAHGHDLETT